MAKTNSPNDLPLPPSLSSLRRRLLTANPEPARSPEHPKPQADTDAMSDSVDFNTVAPGEAQEPAEAPRVPVGYDEVEALLQRYQLERGRSGSEQGLRPAPPPPAQNGRRRASVTSGERLKPASFHGESLRESGGSKLVPPPAAVNGTGHAAGNSELEILTTENAELRAMVAELRQYLEENDPQLWEERLKQAETLVAERDEEIAAQKKQLDEWQEKLQANRFVPSDDELAKMADELEKERCQLTQEKRKLEEDRQQLQDDEESLMRQMREMEMGMAKERAELARQRTELQRLHSEVKHELELMQRGDATVKERLAVFQRRHAETMRPSGPPRQSPSPVAPPMATPAPDQPARPKDSGVFKRLFGQG